MPNMISLRNFRLASTTGHVIQFEARVARDVPDVLVPEAMAAGCVPTDETDIPFHEDLSRAKIEFQGDIRRSMLFLAVKLVAETNAAKDFDGGGVPKVKTISDRLGYEVSRKELIDIWQQYLTTKAEDREYALHPQAANILLVLEAETKDELIALAEEFGVDGAKAKGLMVKDLRKLLLVKFSGIAAG